MSDPDVNRIIYSAGPQDGGVGEGSWAGLCFSPTQWSNVSFLNQKGLFSKQKMMHLMT